MLPSAPLLFAARSQSPAQSSDLERALLQVLLASEEGRAMIRGLLARVVTVSKETGGLLMGITPRHFYGVAHREGVEVLGLSDQSHRYSIASLIEKRDALCIGAKVDPLAMQVRMEELMLELFRKVDLRDVVRELNRGRHAA